MTALAVTLKTPSTSPTLPSPNSSPCRVPMHGIPSGRFAKGTLHLLLLILVFAPSLPAQSLSAQTLSERISPLIQAHPGKVAVAVMHLEKGDSFVHSGDEVFPTASLIKLAVMVEAYRQVDAGTRKLEDRIRLKQEDFVPGSGILTQHFSAGTELSFRDAIRLMIAYSDNSATNLVVEHIGLRSTSDTMESFGLKETKIHSLVFRRERSIFPDRSVKYGLGSTTANEMVELLAKLNKGELASKESTQAMIGHLLACEDQSCLAAKLPAETKLAHKSGAVTGVRTDAGTLMIPGGNIAICVLTNENQDQSWKDDNQANVLCADIARAVYDHYQATGESTTTKQMALKLGSSGVTVKSLQRALNNELSPSPELMIDGEFGPATEAALIRFQSKNNLPETGIADEQTWKLLEPSAIFY